MAKLKLCITNDDIASAERYKISNPVLHKLQNTTGTLWRLCSDGLVTETMPPFRATLLPLWAMNGWHENSANKCSLPRELDLELYQLQPDGAACGHDSSNESQPFFADGAISDEAVQNALLQILENNGWSSWRAVCPHILIERVEPYRTLVLTSAARDIAREWLQSLAESVAPRHHRAGSTPGMEPPLRLPAELHSPLTGEKVQPITINFPPRLFFAAPVQSDSLHEEYLLAAVNSPACSIISSSGPVSQAAF